MHSCLQAYQVLSNKEKRRLYDWEGHAAADPMDEEVDDLFFTFTDLFHDSDGQFFQQPSAHWTLNDFEDEDDYFYPQCRSDPYFSFDDESDDFFY